MTEESVEEGGRRGGGRKGKERSIVPAEKGCTGMDMSKAAKSKMP